MKRMTTWALVVLAIAARAGHAADDGRWTAPSIEAKPGQLPKLAQLLAVDGDPKEWAGAASIPVRCRACLSKVYGVYGWGGPADAGMEIYAAWSPDGLALAATVSDNDLVARDALDFYLAGAPSAASGESAPRPGVCKITVHPPLAGKAPQLAMAEAAEGGPAVKFAGKKTDGGWTTELLVPWGLVPGAAPAEGGHVGMQFALNESDSRMWQTYILTILTPGGVQGWGKKGVEVKPQDLPQWTLVDSLRPGGEATLAPMVAVDTPRAVGLEPAPPIGVEVGTLLSDRVGAIRVAVVDPEGKTISDQPAEKRAGPPPYAKSACARANWPAETGRDGFYIVDVTIEGTDGKPLAEVKRPVLFVGQTLRGSYDRIAKADVKTIARTEPFKAADWLGAGAMVERMKEAVERGDVREVVLRGRELEARMTALETSKPVPPSDRPFDLLNLARGRTGGVALEFTEPKACTATLFWGSVPLACVSIAERDGADSARQAIGAEGKASVVGEASDEIELDGMPGRVTTGGKAGDSAIQLAVAAGPRVITATASSRKTAEMAARLVAAGKPVAESDLDALRRQTVADLAPKADPAAGDGKDLCLGDIHMHSTYSDGTASPVGLMLLSMYTMFDYAVMSDHNNIEGAMLARRLLQEHGVEFPVIVGQEVSAPIHMNVYPVKERVPWTLSPEETARQAHAQGAVIQWNHPGPKNEWAKKHIQEGIAGTGLDAWEHFPAKYKEWKAAGTLPQIIGSTDEHFGFLGPRMERTLFFAASPTGEALAAAVRAKEAVGLYGKRAGIFYGPDDAAIAKVWASLAEGAAMKETKAARLKVALQNADLAGLLRDSPVEVAPFPPLKGAQAAAADQTADDSEE